MTLATFGWNKMASSEAVAAVGLERLLKNAAVTGLASGLPGGLANVEISSFVNEGSFTADPAKIRQSMYEMAVVGGLFGASSSLLARIGAAPHSTQARHQLDNLAQFEIPNNDSRWSLPFAVQGSEGQFALSAMNRTKFVAELFKESPSGSGKYGSLKPIKFSSSDFSSLVKSITNETSETASVHESSRAHLKELWARKARWSTNLRKPFITVLSPISKSWIGSFQKRRSGESPC